MESPIVSLRPEADLTTVNPETLRGICGDAAQEL